MDRPPHNFPPASAMAYAQQQRQAAANIQQQFGFHPQHQQFPTNVHAPPFLTPHPSQFPYHAHIQQQPQLQPHPPPHPQLLHLQQQQQPQPPHSFPSHLPPHLSSPFHGPYDTPPSFAAPPSDPELQKRIDKLVEYATKNGPEFEAMIREKQQDNPDYSFLFGGEGNGYYRYKLWLSTRPPGGPYTSFPPSSIPMMHPPPNPALNPSLNAPPMSAAAAVGAMAAPQLHPPAFPPFFDQQHHQHPQPFVGHGRTDYDHSFKGLSGPLPSDVAMELTNVLDNLNGTKESIKSAKIWFMQRAPFAPALAEALRDRVFALDDSERQLHVIYLANDILFDRYFSVLFFTELFCWYAVVVVV